MKEDLVVRVVGSLGTVAILLIAIVVGALLGDGPDEMFIWSAVVVIMLSMDAIAAVYHFEDRIL